MQRARACCRPRSAPSNAYRCRDGIVLIAGNGDTIYRRLMKRIEREDLATDPDLQVNAGRVQRVAEIDDAIEQWTRTRSVNDVLAAMEAANVPAGRVYDRRHCERSAVPGRAR